MFHTTFQFHCFTISRTVLIYHLLISSFSIFLGKDYMTTNKKTNSAPALFKFIGIDLFETPEAHRNMAAHPKNRVHLARERY